MGPDSALWYLARAARSAARASRAPRTNGAVVRITLPPARARRGTPRRFQSAWPPSRPGPTLSGRRAARSGRAPSSRALMHRLLRTRRRRALPAAARRERVRAASSGRRRHRDVRRVLWPTYWPCATPLLQTPGESWVTVSSAGGVVQPFAMPETSRPAACASRRSTTRARSACCSGISTGSCPTRPRSRCAPSLIDTPHDVRREPDHRSARRS